MCISFLVITVKYLVNKLLRVAGTSPAISEDVLGHCTIGRIAKPEGVKLFYNPPLNLVYRTRLSSQGKQKTCLQTIEQIESKDIFLKADFLAL